MAPTCILLYILNYLWIIYNTQYNVSAVYIVVLYCVGNNQEKKICTCWMNKDKVPLPNIFGFWFAGSSDMDPTDTEDQL